jgi:hypothetical protein
VRRIILRKVFPELRKRGIFAKKSPELTSTSALYAMSQEVQKRGKRGGIVFWHLQDHWRFQETGELTLAFNHSDDNPTPRAIVAVGRFVEETCRKYGLTTTWNGTSRRRIDVALW